MDRCMNWTRIGAVALLNFVMATLSVAAQDPSPRLAETAPLRAIPLDAGSTLLFHSLFEDAHLNFIRDLRRVPLVEMTGTPTSPILQRHLDAPTSVIATEYTYLESNWLTPGQLLQIASHIHKTRSVLLDLFGQVPPGKIEALILRTEEEYLCVVDAMTIDEVQRRQARHVSSTFVGSLRVGHESSFLQACTMAISDTVLRFQPACVRNRTALREGLHVYLSAFVTLDYSHYVDLETTTPRMRGEEGIEALFRAARGYIDRKDRLDLATIAGLDLNSLTFEHLSMMFALWDFLLRHHRENLPEISIDPAGLELQLFDFIHTTYALSEEDVARRLNLDRLVKPNRFKTFAIVAEKKRKGQRCTSSGEETYRAVREVLQNAMKQRETGL